MPTLSEQAASKATSIVQTLQQTDYRYPERIDANHGIYDCDCSGFAGYVLQAVAPDRE